MIKRLSFLIFAVLFAYQPVDAQNLSRQGEFVNNFRSLNIDLSRERVFLHTDRQWYVFGDRIWVSAYVVDGSRLIRSTLSNVLYVELLDPDGDLVERVYLKIERGRGSGNLTFGEISPRAGTYQIRAYTAYALNFGESYIFKQDIQVYTDEIEIASIYDTDDIDVQFFPEGGDLIDGITTRVGVKAIGPDGLHRNISGSVFNENGQEVARFTSEHLGMGYFEFTPDINETYTARVRGMSYEFPNVRSSGTTLRVDAQDTQFEVKSFSNEIDDHESLFLFAHVRGEVFFAGRLNQTPNYGVTWISRDLFPTGVIHFTLLDTNGLPVSERLAFNINELDEATAQTEFRTGIEIQDDYYSFEMRDEVELFFSVTNHENDLVRGSASISVFDDQVDTFNPYATNIITRFYLESDIVGFVEDPGFYFSKNDNALEHADLLMLTQGWRAFNMNDIVNITELQIQSFPERGFRITGNVRSDLLRRQLQEANIVYSLGPANEELFLVQTDALGDFVIDELQFFGNEQITIRANDAEGRDRVLIGLNPQFDHLPENEDPIKQRITESQPERARQTETEIDPLTFDERAALAQIDTERFLDAQMSVLLDDVVVTAERENIDTFERSLGVMRTRSQRVDLDESPHLQDAPFLAVLTQIPGVTVLGMDQLRVSTGALSLSGTPDPLIIIDDVITDAEDLFSLTTMDVQTVNVFRRASELAVWGSQGTGGVISVRTRRGFSGSRQMRGLITAQLEGYQIPVRFYSPRYGFVTPDEEESVDNRITLHWDPIFSFTPNGGTIRFWTNDVPSEYRIEIQGITQNGKPFYKTRTFNLRP